MIKKKKNERNKVVHTRRKGRDDWLVKIYLTFIRYIFLKRSTVAKENMRTKKRQLISAKNIWSLQQSTF